MEPRTSSPTEHSLLIALRELDGLEQQRRDREAAAAAEHAAAAARARAEAEARVRAEIDARAAAEAARRAAEAAEQGRRDHEVRLRTAEAEARVRGEQAARLHAVEAEIAAQIDGTRRKETVRQRLAAAAVIGALGLVGALGAMLLTRPVAPVIVAAADDDHVATMRAYTATLEQLQRDVSRLREDNAASSAFLDAAGALLDRPPPAPAPIAKAPPPRPRPSKTTPETPTAKPTKGNIIICNPEDPLAEECPVKKK